MAQIGKLEEALKIKASIERAQAELKALEADEAYKKEAALLADLDKLIDTHSLSDQDVVDVIVARSPEVKIKKPGKAGSKGGGAGRWTKVYTNPNTKDVVEAASGANGTLKEWKAEHGDEEVEGWRSKAKEANHPKNKGRTPPKGDPLHGT